MIGTMKLLVGALVLTTSAALDAKLNDVVCQQDLPLSIADDGNFKIVCPDSGSSTDAEVCSFHGDTATLSGNCKRSCIEFETIHSSQSHMSLSYSPLQSLIRASRMLD